MEAAQPVEARCWEGVLFRQYWKHADFLEKQPEHPASFCGRVEMVMMHGSATHLFLSDHVPITKCFTDTPTTQKTIAAGILILPRSTETR